MYRLLVGFAVILLAAGCGANLAGEPQIVATLPPMTPIPTSEPGAAIPAAADLSVGQSLFAENCTACHGIAGQGDGELVASGEVSAPVDFTQHLSTIDQSPQMWFTSISEGNLAALMPPWKNSMSEPDRWAVTMYSYTLPYSAEQIAVGEQVWVDSCASCHGVDGSGGEQASLDLSHLGNTILASDQDWLDLVANGNGTMPAFVDDLTPDERLAVVMYTRTLALSDQPVSAPVEVAGADTSSADREAAAPVFGTVRGQVDNMTAGAAVPEDLQVMLHIVDENFNEQTAEATLLSDNTFEIGGVPINPGWRYFVTTFYDTGYFSSDLYTMSNPISTEIDLPVSLAERSTDPSALSIKAIMMQIDPMIDGLQIAQVITYSNPTDRMYLSDNVVGVVNDQDYNVSVEVPIPAGALIIDTPQQREGRFFRTDDDLNVVDTNPVFPGDTHRVQIVYRMPYTAEDTIDFFQAMPYPIVGSVELIVAESLALNSEAFDAVDTDNPMAAGYDIYGRDVSLSVGEALAYRVTIPAEARPNVPDDADHAGITGIGPIDPNAQMPDDANHAGVDAGTIPVSVDGSRSTTSWVRVVLAVVGGLAVAVGVLLYLRDWLSPEQDDLIEQIAELDRRFHAGKITEAKYQAQRKRLKSRLTKVIQQAES